MKTKGMFLAFLCFVLSVFIYYEFPGFSFFYFPLFFFLLIVILKLVFKRKVIMVCLLALSFVFGGMYTLFRLENKNSALKEYEGKQCRIYAKVCGVQNENEYFDTYLIKIDKVCNIFGEKEIKTSEKAELAVKDGSKRKLKYGDYICTLAETEKINAPDNRGETNYSKIKMADNIFYSVKAKNSDIKIYSHFDKVSDIYDAAYVIRNYITDTAFEKLGKKQAALLCAVLISDKSGLDKEVKENLEKAGISHIAAASGMHAGCIVLIITALLGIFKIKRKYAMALSFPVLVMYVFVNNCSVSVMRASIMTGIYIFSQFIGRDEDRFINIAFAGIFILILNPFSVFDAGFVLSFSCVVSIALFYEPIMNFVHKRFLFKVNRSSFRYRIIYYFLSAGIVSITAQAAAIPLCAYYFGKINVYALAANLLVSWCLPYLMLCAAAMCALRFVPFINIVFSFASQIICSYVLLVIKIISGFWFSQLEVCVSVCFVIVFICCGAALYLLMKKFLKLSCALFGLCAILIIVKTGFNLYENSRLSVNFVNVGQADACFVKTSLNGAVVIDAGGKNSSFEDTAFTDYMKRCGVKNVKYIFVSHFDTDHAKNVLSVMDNFKVSNVVMPYRSEKVKIKYRDLIAQKARETGCSVIYAADTDEFEISKNMKAKVLAPPGSIKYFESENEGSMALKLSVKDKSILFLGDLTKNVQEAMMMKYKDNLKCDILKVSHHGDIDSFCAPLTAKFAKPDYAVINCGKNNIYKHPDKETVYLIEKMKILPLRTDICRDIRFYVEDDDLVCDCDNMWGEN